MSTGDTKPEEAKDEQIIPDLEIPPIYSLTDLLLMGNKASQQMVVEYLSCSYKSLSPMCLSHPRYNLRQVWMHDHRKRWGAKVGQGRKCSLGYSCIMLHTCRQRRTRKEQGGKGRRPSGWSGDFVLRQIVDSPCRINEKQLFIDQRNSHRVSSHNLTGPPFLGLLN